MDEDDFWCDILICLASCAAGQEERDLRDGRGRGVLRVRWLAGDCLRGRG
jgi:hypothetical protein